MPLNKQPLPFEKTITKSDVLTNLSFLEEGAAWPPHSQRPRLARYARNKGKFDNELNINKKAYDMIVSVVNDRFRVISYRMLVNIYRKVSYRTADFLFVERPKYVTEEAKQDTLTNIVDLSGLGSIGYQGALDTSIYGDSIYTVEVDGNEEEDPKDPNKGRMGISNPRYWFPVVQESNLKKFKYHVLAWVITKMIPDKNNKLKEQAFLRYQIHEKGSYKEQERMIEDDGTLGPLTDLGEDHQEEIDTGIKDFAVVPTHGVVTSDSVFGIDDYTDLISLIDELQIRLEKIAHILDKHSDPSMSGPTSALKQDPETGEYYLSMGDYFQRDSKDDPDVKYITWDGKLEFSFKEIEIIMQLLSIISEMGASIFEKDGDGSAESGRALKLRFTIPLIKVSRLRNNFDDAFKHALSLSSQVGWGEGQAMTRQEISIKWQDGLPNDAFEKAEIGNIRTGGKATDTVTAQIMEQDNLNQEDAQAKAEEIQAEQFAMETRGGFNADQFGGDDVEEQKERGGR